MTCLRFVVICAILTGGCAERSRLSQVLAPCAIAEGPTDARCGVLDVWENREAKSGRRIALKIVVVPSLRPSAARHPVFVLAGGPGQGAAALVDTWRRQLEPIRRDHDIVLVDSRGTGASHPLECSKAGTFVQDAESDTRSAQVLRACLASYVGYADVTQYTTANTVDDLEDVRAFLGYSRIDLYGVSYGTRVAMLYVSRYRTHVGAVVLDSVFPPDNHMPFFLAHDAQRSLDLLVRDCEADAACRSRFSNLGTRIQALLAHIGASPRQVVVRDPRTGTIRDATVTRPLIARTLLTALYVPEWSAMVPLLIEQAEHGQFDGWLAIEQLSERLSSTVSKGIEYSVLCAEDVPAGLRASFQPATDSFLASDAELSARQFCSVWPSVRERPSGWHLEPSDVPALLISGELDPITPPSWAALLASRWTRTQQVVVPGTSHNASASDCVVEIMSAFLDDPNTQIETSCVVRRRRPPFVMDTSGSDLSER